MHRSPALAAALLLSTLPGAAAADPSNSAPWSLTVQGWGGVHRYDVLGLKNAWEANGGRDLLDEEVAAAGVSAVLRLSWFEVGLLYEGTVLRDQTDSAVVTPLVGFRSNLGENLRLELLGELGGHRLTYVGISDGVTAKEALTVWLPYAGVRPVLTFASPLGAVRAVFSVAPFARWDLHEKTVDVTVGGVSTQVDSYRAGGVTYGVVVGAGLEL